MATQGPAVGRVEHLCINGDQCSTIHFEYEGPTGDRHAGERRTLSGHDGEYLRTSDLKVGSPVFNWRSWTALSHEEWDQVQQSLNVRIPVGCLLENMIISNVPGFSKLLPTTRLVFPTRAGRQAILAVWEENYPCSGVGDRLQKHYKQDGLSKQFVAEARGRRGVMGFVLSPGIVQGGDNVFIYPPVS